ncbi:HDOD domain-containing protein [Desulfovibrio aminophilus]|nr:HDOD domain-containing protein [Desulfovibrio aminophilus]MCM0755744.1 HDOD domain-containing protein [Desulfovibrio aminophilus]
MSRREEILARVKTVEALPSAIQQAIDLLGDADADMGELARIIEFDPGLTSNVLRLVNSPYFGGLRTITSLREAVVRLGAGQVFQLLIACGVIPCMRAEIKGYGLSPGMLLEHSVVAAVAARTVARELGLTAPDHTFTAALLSNIGKIVLGTFLEVDAGPILEIATRHGLTFEAAEEAVLGISHDEVGAALLEHWHLPEPIVFAVRWRLKPEQAPRRDLALDLVHMGSALALMTGLGVGVDGLNYRPSPVVAERLGLDAAALERILASVVTALDEVRALFTA